MGGGGELVSRGALHIAFEPASSTSQHRHLCQHTSERLLALQAQFLRLRMCPGKRGCGYMLPHLALDVTAGPTSLTTGLLHVVHHSPRHLNAFRPDKIKLWTCELGLTSGSAFKQRFECLVLTDKLTCSSAFHAIISHTHILNTLQCTEPNSEVRSII